MRIRYRADGDNFNIATVSGVYFDPETLFFTFYITDGNGSDTDYARIKFAESKLQSADAIVVDNVIKQFLVNGYYDFSSEELYGELEWPDENGEFANGGN